MDKVRFTTRAGRSPRISVLVNQRQRNTDGEWVDGEPTRHVVRAFKTLGDNIAESLSKGDRVFVHGTATTDPWTDNQTGDERTARRVLAEVVGPSLRWATTRVTKTTRSQADDETPESEVCPAAGGGRPTRSRLRAPSSARGEVASV